MWLHHQQHNFESEMICLGVFKMDFGDLNFFIFHLLPLSGCYFYFSTFWRALIFLISLAKYKRLNDDRVVILPWSHYSYNRSEIIADNAASKEALYSFLPSALMPQ